MAFTSDLTAEGTLISPQAQAQLKEKSLWRGLSSKSKRQQETHQGPFPKVRKPVLMLNFYF